MAGALLYRVKRLVVKTHTHNSFIECSIEAEFCLVEMAPSAPSRRPPRHRDEFNGFPGRRGAIRSRGDIRGLGRGVIRGLGRGLIRGLGRGLLRDWVGGLLGDWFGGYYGIGSGVISRLGRG